MVVMVLVLYLLYYILMQLDFHLKMVVLVQPYKILHNLMPIYLLYNHMVNAKLILVQDKVVYQL